MDRCDNGRFMTTGQMLADTCGHSGLCGACQMRSAASLFLSIGYSILTDVEPTDVDADVVALVRNQLRTFALYLSDIANTPIAETAAEDRRGLAAAIERHARRAANTLSSETKH